LPDDPAIASLARQAADACITHVPRPSALGQCCGAASVGNFLIDVAILNPGERYWEAAYGVAAHLLRRSADPAKHLADQRRSR
jgi:hypothetical protein